MYFTTYNESQDHFTSQPKCKQSEYGTVLFIPQNFRLDFGRSVWPSPYQKKICSPIILFCQGWTDGRSGFVGGQIEKDESVLEASSSKKLVRQFISRCRSIYSPTSILREIRCRMFSYGQLTIENTSRLSYPTSMVVPTAKPTWMR